MAMLNQSILSFTYSILWQALNILSKNYRPLLPIMLFYLLFSSLLALSNYLSITATLTEFRESFASLSRSVPKSPEYENIISTMRKDLREITTIEAIFFFTSVTISSVITMTSIHIISMSCAHKQHLTPQELFSLIRRTWKGPMLTQLLAMLLYLASSFFILFLIIAFIFISIGSTTYTICGVLLSILAILFFLYLALICSLSIVVSVVEEGCYGLSALGRSVELAKGMRQNGILIMLVMTVISIIISAVYSFSMLHAPANFLVRLVVGFVHLVVSVMMNVYALTVITIFYYECKDYGRELLGLDGGLAYSNLSTEIDATLIP